VAPKRKPERADVCIIGAGATGAAAAKVLTGNGLRVVGLERGPWRKKETFGGDELANVNRYNLWPDPLLNPRTVVRPETGSTEPIVELFCPVPQMVGGGTAHWQGWLPRFTPNDFRLRTVVGELPGTTLADWPITYDELEPYYSKVEWAFGVSGDGGANKFEGPRSREYPCPPLPLSHYARKFNEGCNALGWNAFPTPQAALSRPLNGRRPTVISAFAQQHGDPSGTRSSALNVFVPDAVATGRYELRPDCYVREITVDDRGRAKGAVYADADGDLIEQAADVIVLACGAVETARLLLLSQSTRFPNGLANTSDLVGRNVTFHEYSGRWPVRRPGVCLGRRRLRQCQQLPVLRTRRLPRVRRRRTHRMRRGRHPATHQLGPAGPPAVGRAGQANGPGLLQSQHGGRHGGARYAPARQPD
jgi:choline dehydrogenase-like flavoprotein